MTDEPEASVPGYVALVTFIAGVFVGVGMLAFVIYAYNHGWPI
jgi:hypothetical protein